MLALPHGCRIARQIPTTNNSHQSVEQCGVCPKRSSVLRDGKRNLGEAQIGGCFFRGFLARPPHIKGRTELWQPEARQPSCAASMIPSLHMSGVRDPGVSHDKEDNKVGRKLSLRALHSGCRQWTLHVCLSCGLYAPQGTLHGKITGRQIYHPAPRIVHSGSSTKSKEPCHSLSWLVACKSLDNGAGLAAVGIHDPGHANGRKSLDVPVEVMKSPLD